MRKIVLILCAALLMGACASVSTDSDEAAIAYTGGPIEGVKFDRIVGPGSGRVWLGVGDNKYIYPTTTRTYIVSKDSTGDRASADIINATSSDGATIGWEVAVYFKLNLSLLREFHENIGQKYDAYKSEGWNQMLNDTLRQQLESALQTTSRKYSVEEYRKEADVLAEINKEIAQGLKDNVNEVLGNDYFCGPTFNGTVKDDKGKTACPDFEVVVKRPNFPGVIEDEYNNQVAARQAVVTAQRQAEKLLEQAQGKANAQIAGAQGEAEAAAKIVSLLQNPNYIEYLRAQAMLNCAQSPNCTLVVTPDGNVNVNTGGK